MKLHILTLFNHQTFNIKLKKIQLFENWNIFYTPILLMGKDTLIFKTLLD